MASELEGVAELTAQLVDLGAQVAARELKGTVKAALVEAEHRARSRIPQGTRPHKTHTGRLVSPGFAVSTLGIKTLLSKKTGGAVAILGVAPEAFYAVQFVEFGTSRNAAQPWLRPAFEESESAMLTKVTEELRSRIRKILRKSGLRRGQRARRAARLAGGR